MLKFAYWQMKLGMLPQSSLVPSTDVAVAFLMTPLIGTHPRNCYKIGSNIVVIENAARTQESRLISCEKDLIV